MASEADRQTEDHTEDPTDWGHNPLVDQDLTQINSQASTQNFTPTFMMGLNDKGDKGSLDTEFMADHEDDLVPTEPSENSPEEAGHGGNHLNFQNHPQVANLEPNDFKGFVNSVTTKMTTAIECMTGIADEMANLEKKVDGIHANQKMMQIRSLELESEINRSKVYTKNRIHGLIKDISDRDYEKCNVVVYNLPLNDWHKYLQMHGNDSKKAAFAYGLYFVKYYIKDYNPIDLSVVKLKQDEKSKESSSKHFRLLLKLATPSDAIRLRKRCLRSNFYTIRPGMTPLERQVTVLCQHKIDEMNGKLPASSKTMYIRKYQFSIAEVKRDNPNHVVNWIEWLDQEKEELSTSKISPLTLIDVKGNSAKTPTTPPVSMPTNHNNQNFSSKPLENSRPSTIKIPNDVRLDSTIDLSGILPMAPKSPIKNRIGNTPRVAPISKPAKNNLPPRTTPSFNFQPTTPNSRGALNVDSTRRPQPRNLNMSNVYAPTFMNSPSSKRKATSPPDKEKSTKSRRRAPQLSEEERKLKNKINNDKRKLKKEEELKKAKEREEERELKVEALMRLLREEQDKSRALQNVL